MCDLRRVKKGGSRYCLIMRLLDDLVPVSLPELPKPKGRARGRPAVAVDAAAAASGEVGGGPKETLPPKPKEKLPVAQASLSVPDSPCILPRKGGGRGKGKGKGLGLLDVRLWDPLLPFRKNAFGL